MAIGRNTAWKKLQALWLGSNPIGWKTAVAVGCNSTWKAIQKIRVMEISELCSERINALKAILLPENKQAIFKGTDYEESSQI